MSDSYPIRVGVIGTGFISRHFALALEHRSDLVLSRVLTRRPLDSCDDFVFPSRLTNSLTDLIDQCDVVVECCGDPIYATDVISQVLEASLPVVTMDAEFHITAGSYFVGRGLVTEAEGDQPGCLAALAAEARELGFRPLVYGNMKGFLDHRPTPESMEYWAQRQGLTLPMVTSFTDGTKVEIEQALVANGLEATIAVPGLLGLNEDDLEVASRVLAERAREIGQPISDYVLSPELPHGVFIVAEHDERQRDALRYLKLGDGPFYTIVKNNIFVHLEIAKTIKQAVVDGSCLLNNTEHPTVSVATVAKHSLPAGTQIKRGLGSFDVRGMAVQIRQHSGHVPIGLMANALIVEEVEEGATITFDQVEIPPSLALDAWRWTERRVLSQPEQAGSPTT